MTRSVRSRCQRFKHRKRSNTTLLEILLSVILGYVIRALPCELPLRLAETSVTVRPLPLAGCQATPLVFPLQSSFRITICRHSRSKASECTHLTLVPRRRPRHRQLVNRRCTSRGFTALRQRTLICQVESTPQCCARGASDGRSLVGADSSSRAPSKTEADDRLSGLAGVKCS